MSDYLTSELMAWHLKCLAEYDEEIKGKALTPVEEEAEEISFGRQLQKVKLLRLSFNLKVANEK